MQRDDLLRFIGPPPSPSVWWPVLAGVLVAVGALWCGAVIVWTLPPERLRNIPLLRNLHAHLLRRRFSRTIRQTTQAYQGRALTPAQAGAAYSRALRSFLYLRTGIRAQYLHLPELADGELADAVPLLAALHDVQFNQQTCTDVAALGNSAEEVIRRWN